MTMVLCVYLSSACLCLAVLSLLNRRKLRLASRILLISQTPVKRDDKESDGLPTRSLVDTLMARLADVSVRLTPSTQRRRAEERLRAAGVETPSALRRFRGIRFAARLTLALMGIVWLISSPTLASMDGLVILAALEEVTPRIWLVTQMRKRSLEVEQGFPGLLDLLTICVEAGLGFDQALARVARSTVGRLGSELRQAIAEMGLGKTRKEALQEMVSRLDSEDIRAFVTAVLQADRLGMGMGQVLRLQSEDARKRLRQRAQEKAMKAPIKILFPLVFFLFPGLFIVILGPAMIHVMALFAAHG